jgi:cell division protein FtsB
MKKVIVALLACLGLFMFAACGASNPVDLGSLESKIAGLQDRVSGLETENGSLKDGVSGLQTENGKLKDDIAALSGLEDGGLGDIEARIEALEEENKRLNSEIENLGGGSTNPNQPFFDWDNPIVIDDFEAYYALHEENFAEFSGLYYYKVLQITGEVDEVIDNIQSGGFYAATIKGLNTNYSINVYFAKLDEIKKHENQTVTIKGIPGLTNPYSISLDWCRVVSVE